MFAELGVPTGLRVGGLGPQPPPRGGGGLRVELEAMAKAGAAQDFLGAQGVGVFLSGFNGGGRPGAGRTEDSDWEAVLKDVRATFGPVTVLVNNAALKASVAGDGGLLDTPVPVWDRVFAANLRGPMLGTRRVLPDMLEVGTGSIVMMTSTSALHSVAGFATAYSSAKAGMIGLTRMIAATYGTQGVRCNAIAPGVIMVGDDTASQEAFRESSGGLTQRPGRPADIASTAVFLASEAGEYINGQVLVVDGGLTTHMPGPSKTARA